MLRLSKKVEYGLISLQYLAMKPNDLVSAKEIAKNLDISFEFLSKTMQSLMKAGLIKSQQGIKGGYFLTRSADKITIAEVIMALDEKSNIVDCIGSFSFDGDICCRADGCTIRNPIKKLQDKINEIFYTTSLEELITHKELQTEFLNNNHFIEIKNIKG